MKTRVASAASGGISLVTEDSISILKMTSQPSLENILEFRLMCLI